MPTLQPPVFISQRISPKHNFHPKDNKSTHHTTEALAHPHFSQPSPTYDSRIILPSSNFAIATMNNLPPAITDAKVARIAYLINPRIAHSDQLAHVGINARNFMSSISATLQEGGEEMGDKWPGWVQAEMTEEPRVVVDTHVHILQTLHSWNAPGPGGLVRKVHDSEFEQCQKLFAPEAAGGIAEVRGYIQDMEETRDDLTELKKEIRALLQTLEGAKPAFEAQGLLHCHVKLESDFAAWSDVLESVLSPTDGGLIRAIQVGLRAWLQRAKKEWEDEMLLTKLVPVT